jgi:signal transduction histidine kinase
MHPFDEMKSWVRFGPADEARLQALWPFVQPELESLTDTFYERVLAHPGAAAVFKDEAQVDRLKVTLRSWVEELLLGPWDAAYYVRRERIGRVHVEVRLPTRYMFTSMNVMADELCALARRHMGDEATEVSRSVGKVTDLDLAIMTGTYVEGREQEQMTTLQDLIVSHMPVTVLLLDADGVVTAATRPSVRLFGDVAVVGRRYADALPPALVNAADLASNVQYALETQREITLTRVDVGLDGLERNFRISIVPLDHPRARVLVHLEELTDAIRTESRLARSESLAQLGALSAAVAHELRNPLAGISGAIQMISRQMPQDDRRKPIMIKIEQQVRRLDALVTDLLDFARPITARATEVRLEDVARTVADLVQRDHPGVAVTISGTGSASADLNLVHQVLLNLLLNAIQAMEGAGQVQVDIQPGRVVVSDSGPGIPPENVDKIFSSFFTTKSRGTGLGLAICRKSAGAMGGQLTLGRGPLPGAAFVLELPRG